jgi:hypothetical protein
LTLLGRAGAKILAKSLERAVIGLMAPFDAQHLQIMIDNKWYVIESVLWAANQQPNYPQELSQEEVKQMEASRDRTTRMALAALGFARMITSRFPRPLVEEYLNLEYAFKWLKNKRPELLPILETEEGRRWLENEVERDIKPYLWPTLNPRKEAEKGEDKK